LSLAVLRFNADLKGARQSVNLRDAPIRASFSKVMLNVVLVIITSVIRSAPTAVTRIAKVITRIRRLAIFSGMLFRWSVNSEYYDSAYDWQQPNHQKLN
jgi:hypothetical protein